MFFIGLRRLYSIALFLITFFSTVLSAQTIIETDGDFNLYSNGIVTCSDADNLEMGTLDGTTYTKRTSAQITTGNAEVSCTSGITDMKSLFENEYSFNSDVSSWDVSSVTSMNSLFFANSEFNQDISAWDVSKVTDMYGMFLGAFKFNQDLGSWNVGSVTTMSNMFNYAYVFNQDISSWDVTNVTNMDYMLSQNNVFSQDLSSWCVSLITSEPESFGNSGTDPNWGSCNFRLAKNGETIICTDAANGDSKMINGETYTKRSVAQITIANAANTCTSGITTMNSLFEDSTTFNANIGSWDVSSVTDMDNMFDNATAFSQDLSNWEMCLISTEPTNFGNSGTDPTWGSCSFMLAGNSTTVDCSSATVGDTRTVNGVAYTKRQQLEITEGNAATSCTSDITDMSNLFYDAFEFNEDISTWDVSSVTNMSAMFQEAFTFNQDISKWDVSSVTNMNSMFRDASEFDADLSAWDVSNVTDMDYLFSGVYEFNADLSSWDVSSVTTMNATFQFAAAFNQDLSSWEVDSVDFMSKLFMASAFNQDISNWNVSGVYDMSFMFSSLDSFNQDLSSWDVSSVSNMANMFSGADSINQDLSSWDVSNVTNMSSMFYEAKIFNQNLDNWEVSKVTNMRYMFFDADSLNQDLSSWDVSSVTDMSYMFYGANTFNQDISSWDVSSVTNMGNMFNLASAFNQNLDNWCVTLITSEPANFGNAGTDPFWGGCPNVQFYFGGPSNSTVFCPEAENLDEGLLDGVIYVKRNRYQITEANSSTTCTSGITNLFNPHYIDYYFNEDISSWDVSSVTNMEYLFSGAHFFNQDISDWDVSSVTSMLYMFRSASNFDQDISSWDVGKVTNMYGMFSYTDTFDQELNSWDVSSVRLMTNLFHTATAFNSDISNWDVSNVVHMSYMFYEATDFNQDLSNWCVSKLWEPTHFKSESSLTNANSPVWRSCPGGQSILGNEGWRLLSFPITNGTVQDILDDTQVQGITGGIDPEEPANFYFYDDSGVFEKPADINTPFGDGKGFALYFYNNDTGTSSDLPIGVDAEGAEPSSDVVVAINPVASGYTLVGNPFNSNFTTDASNLVVSGANIQNNIHFWNDEYGSYNSSDRTTPYVIEPWQGFWVQTDAFGGETTLTFNTEGKTDSAANGSYFSKTVASNRGDIHFTLTSETTYDEAIRIAFRETATTEYDLDDAGKMVPLISAYATIAFFTNDIMKSVESLPYDLQEEITIPTHLELVGVSGEFTFAWSGLESIPSDWELILHDYELETSVDLRSDENYIFKAEASVQTKVDPQSILSGPIVSKMKANTEANRFGITIRPATVSNETEETPEVFALEQNYPNPFNPSTTISYSVQEAGAVNISVFNLMGQKVATLVDETKAAGQYNVRWNAAGAASGMYYYRLEAGGQSITRKMTLIK